MSLGRLLWLWIALSAAGCAHSGARRTAPIAVRSQHPAQLVVQRLLPVGGDTPEPGEVRARWSNAYTSLFLAGGDATIGTTLELDGEFLRTAIGTRIGLPNGFALDVEIPFGHATGGLLDDFIIDWHDLFGLPAQGRPNAARDQFTVRARRGGQTAFELERNGFQVLDIPLELAWSFLSQDEDQPFGGKLRVGVELPTGNQDRGLGNGELELALGVAGAYTDPDRRWGVSLHAEHTFAGQPNQARAAGLKFRDVTSAGVAGWVPFWWEGWSLLAQVEWETSTLRSLGFARSAHDEVNLWAGVRVDLGTHTDFELALGEDLATFIAPDFTIWLSLQHAFGAPPE